MKDISENLDKIIDKTFNVLDKGFIKIIDYMGNDNSIVQMARVSYGNGTKTLSEDKSLIRYLMRHNHTSPFEACELKFHIKLPIMVARQLFRHRTFSINERSLRYSTAVDDLLCTNNNEWRLQSTVNKQCSDGFIDNILGNDFTTDEKELHDKLFCVYNKRINCGISREQARKDLPLSLYTEAYMKIDLHNLLNFLKLRLDNNAQIEIKEYAKLLSYFVKLWVPITWEAFSDYVINSITFSSVELKLLQKLIKCSEIDELDHLNIKDMSNRELSEFSEKVAKIITQI